MPPAMKDEQRKNLLFEKFFNKDNCLTSVPDCSGKIYIKIMTKPDNKSIKYYLNKVHKRGNYNFKIK